MLLRLSIAAATILVCCAFGQVTTTVAGTNFTFPNTPIPALNAPTGYLYGVAVDSAGNVYMADGINNIVFKLAPNGLLTAFAGNGTLGFSGDGGPATNAALFFPVGVALDKSGDLFIADLGNNVVRKVTRGGIITTVAGNGISGYSGDDGPATSATLTRPTDVAVDGEGNLFILDSGNNRVREVTA